MFMSVPTSIHSNGDTNLGVTSPCVLTCQLNDEDMCMGCFRMITEIVGWRQFTEEVKVSVLHACRNRKLHGLDK